MAEAANVIAVPLTASAGVAGTVTLSVNATLLTIWNRGTAEVFLVAGPASLAAPTVNGANQHFLPVSTSSWDVAIAQAWDQGEQPETALVVQAISSAALSLWIQVDE